VECNEDAKFHRMVKDYKKGNVHNNNNNNSNNNNNNNNKLGDKKEERGQVGAGEDRDHRS
jgi:hypothetical protein